MKGCAERDVKGLRLSVAHIDKVNFITYRLRKWIGQMHLQS